MHLSKDSFDAIAFEDVKKDERTYSVKFAEPLTIQTRRSTVASGCDGFSSPLVRVDLDAETAQVLRDFEAFIKDETKKHKAEWFKKTISDAYLESSFKTYFKDGATATTAFKVAEDFALFDASGNALADASGNALADASANAADFILLLEATQLTFGKTEYGCLWKVRQAVVLPAPKKRECLIQVTDDDEAAAPGTVDDDEDYFL